MSEYDNAANGTEIRRKNPYAVALGRKGGQAKSARKTEAARRNIMQRWHPQPHRPR
jgi:hypothetical protein